MNILGTKPFQRVVSASSFLTSRRIRTHALLLASCLWGVCAVDYATSGILDRKGNVKFQDFLQFPISARLIAQGRSAELYSDQVLAREIRSTVGRDTRVYLQYFYGPQVAVPFIPLLPLPFLAQAAIWAAISLAMYFACVLLLWKCCPALKPYGGLIVLAAIAYPPVFHLFVRGQLSATILLCFTAAYLAFLSRRDWLAGVALGLLAFKPQFLVAIPLVLLLAKAWKPLAGMVVSAGAQLALTYVYFGRPVTQAYLFRLFQSARHPASTELAFSAIQMHSLHSFWELLIPWHSAVWLMYLLSSAVLIGIAAGIWKSSSALPLRFSALMLAAVLVNPHLYIYDLLALAPMFLLLADWSLQNRQHPSKPVLDISLYLAFLLPLFGPVAYWTHVQASVLVFAALLWTLHRMQPRALDVCLS